MYLVGNTCCVSLLIKLILYKKFAVLSILCNILCFYVLFLNIFYVSLGVSRCNAHFQYQVTFSNHKNYSVLFFEGRTVFNSHHNEFWIEWPFLKLYTYWLNIKIKNLWNILKERKNIFAHANLTCLLYFENLSVWIGQIRLCKNGVVC